MKTDYKNHLVETIETVYKTSNAGDSIGSVYAGLYGILVALATPEQLEVMLRYVMKSALNKSNTEK